MRLSDEADGHAAESQNKSHLVFGKAAEYKTMFRNFVRTFQKQNVTNAVFVLDLSSNARNDAADIFPQLYAGDEYVDWIFFNLFQSHKQNAPPEPTRGNCTTIAAMQYEMLERQLSTGVIKDGTKPWGVGAWGTMNSTFGDPKVSQLGGKRIFKDAENRQQSTIITDVCSPAILMLLTPLMCTGWLPLRTDPNNRPRAVPRADERHLR